VVKFDASPPNQNVANYQLELSAMIPTFGSAAGGWVFVRPRRSSAATDMLLPLQNPSEVPIL